MNKFKIAIYKIGYGGEVIFADEDKTIMSIEVFSGHKCCDYVHNVLKNHPESEGCVLNLGNNMEILEILQNFKPYLTSQGCNVISIFESICRKGKIDKLIKEID